MNHVILLLFILISTAFGACDVYFKLDSVPKKINRTEIIEFKQEVTKTTDAYQFIDDSNINDIFSHNYSDDLKGAKAVYYKGADGDYIVVFWKTGEKILATIFIIEMPFIQF